MGDRRSVAIIGTLVAVALAALLGWTLLSSSDLNRARLTEITDSTAIQGAVTLTHVSILTSENYVGQKVRVITGLLRNVFDKPIRLVDLKMVFTDSDGKSLQEGVYSAFEVTRRPLDSGDQFRFEIRFENLPKTWNYRIPITEIVKVGY